MGKESNICKRGQAAVELLSYWAFFFLAFVVLLAYLTGVSQSQLASSQYELAAQYANELGGYYDFAFRAGDGFSGTFPLHRDILGREYSAVFYSSGNLYVQWSAPGGQAQAIVQPVISGAIGRSAGVLANNVSIDTGAGNVRFSNVNGSIIITQ
ncbi:Uncharacterised protein [Candidatus Anstonella stagnisolia]|nr:Uncharacterised protein [Candidatus Anstonella stagnisolia]